jgi:hypothetical protein
VTGPWLVFLPFIFILLTRFVSIIAIDIIEIVPSNLTYIVQPVFVNRTLKLIGSVPVDNQERLFFWILSDLLDFLKTRVLFLQSLIFPFVFVILPV